MTHLYTLAEIRNGTGFDRNAQFVLRSDIPDTSARDKKYQALQDIGKSAAESIAEMVAALECGWHDPGAESEPEEFCILLGTGGPATRIIGKLNGHCEPTRARIQAQDWFTQWTDYTGDAISQDDLLTYCRCFYFGE